MDINYDDDEEESDDGQTLVSVLESNLEKAVTQKQLQQTEMYEFDPFVDEWRFEYPPILTKPNLLSLAKDLDEYHKQAVRTCPVNNKRKLSKKGKEIDLRQRQHAKTSTIRLRGAAYRAIIQVLHFDIFYSKSILG